MLPYSFLATNHVAVFFFANQSRYGIVLFQPIMLLYSFSLTSHITNFFLPTNHVAEFFFANQLHCSIFFVPQSIIRLLHDFSFRAIRDKQTFRRFRVWLAQYITEPHSLWQSTPPLDMPQFYVWWMGKDMTYSRTYCGRSSLRNLLFACFPSAEHTDTYKPFCLRGGTIGGTER